MDKTLDLVKQLIAQPSITPNDSHCQNIISNRLALCGFECESISTGDVTNLWAKRLGTANGSHRSKTLVFAGHTDVVPTGDLKDWLSDPFQPTIREQYLYGRGAADMKSSLAAFVVAAEEFIANHPKHEGNFAFLITSDEEGPAINGTQHVLNVLAKRHESLDYCIVGEPTCHEKLGDTIKNGRRGSLSARLTIYGKQGHVAYPHLACNPIHLAAAAILALTTHVWDEGNADFPATTCQISNYQAGTGAGNIIPGKAQIDFNFRYSTVHSKQSLQETVELLLKQEGLEENQYHLDWHLSGEPFLTKNASLSNAISSAIMAETNIEPKMSTTGGTSDGRFIAKFCPQVIEFGPCNATIHQVNERIEAASLNTLKNIYRRTLENLLITL